MDFYYMNASTAAARTRNARESDSYVSKNVIYPAFMAQIMSQISDASLEGEGHTRWTAKDLEVKEYSTRALCKAIDLVEEKLIALGYRLVSVSKTTYDIWWFNDV